LRLTALQPSLSCLGEAHRAVRTGAKFRLWAEALAKA